MEFHFVLNFFSIKSLKKVFARRYSKNPPSVFPNININVPNHLPKIKPPTKKIGDPKPKSKTQIIVPRKNKRLDKNILLLFIASRVSLLALINS